MPSLNPLRRFSKPSKKKTAYPEYPDSPNVIPVNYGKPIKQKEDSLLKRIFKKKKRPDHVMYRDHETGHFRTSRHHEPLDLLDGDDQYNYSLSQGAHRMLSPPRSEAGESHQALVLPRRPRRKEVVRSYAEEADPSHHRDHYRQPAVVPLSGNPYEGAIPGTPVNVGGATLELLHMPGARGGHERERGRIMVDPETEEITLPPGAVLVVDDGVELEVRDPKTGLFVPYDEYDFNSNRAPTPEDELFMVQPNADVVFEDENGNIIHRTRDQRPRPRHEERDHDGTKSPVDHKNRRSGWQRDGSYLVYHA